MDRPTEPPDRRPDSGATVHDVIVVGAGPVGATLALALSASGLDVVALDARPRGIAGRSDRSLALSHGARLIFERLGVWGEVAAVPGAVTPITVIDVSQRGSFGAARLDATEQGVPAMGYVVSYRALQAALDAALQRAGTRVEHGVTARSIEAAPGYARIATAGGDVAEWTCRVAAVADGSGDRVPGITRKRHDYGQVALTAKLWTRDPHQGVAYERFTPDGPMALLPEGDHFGLVWTTTPEHSVELLALSDSAFIEALAQRFGGRIGMRMGVFERVADRRAFPLALEFARRIIDSHIVLLGNAAQALHPVAGQGFNLGVRDAYELAQTLLDTAPDQIGASASLRRYARRRTSDRWTGIAFTHGLLGIFGNDAAPLRFPRGLALTMLDSLPPLKRVFAHAMMHGVR